jgi:putative dimethyl sulfoxide reductase chaperone
MIPLDVLSRLWLREPDRATLEIARTLWTDAAGSDPDELAATFSELFLLNVYPYGSVFTDRSAELNGRFAAWAESRFRRGGYVTPEFWEAGAPDHVGLCIGFLGHLEKLGEQDREFSQSLLDWIPVCALAVERDPSSNPFYRALAGATRARILDDPGGPTGFAADADADGPPFDENEVRLSDVLSYLLAPARCGLFLSRSRLGQIARQNGLSIPFGGRHEVARALFAAAGEGGAVPALLDALSAEADAWDGAYTRWEADCPEWAPFGRRWRARIEQTRRQLQEMEELLRRPLELEYAEEASE